MARMGTPMSYAVDLYTKDVDGNTIHLKWLNYTSNCARMWNEAGAPLREWNEKPFSEILVKLNSTVAELVHRRTKYEAMNPENGWGDYAGAREFITTIRDIAAKHPSGWIEVDW